MKSKASASALNVSGFMPAKQIAAVCLMMMPIAASAQGSDVYPVGLPHAEDLASMQARPLPDHSRAYRLIWHAWHKKPGMLTLTCARTACTAELRHTNGYGTYRQGRLQRVYRKKVATDEALSVMAALDAGGVWTLPPQLPVGVGMRAGMPEGSELRICLHAPHYYVEAKDGERSILAYRHCQSNYKDGLNAMAPLIALFDRIFPVPLALVKPDPVPPDNSTKAGDVK
jgi:hypothetical protein